MNRFALDWSKTAEAQLADVWVRYPADALAITMAADAIERILATNPLGHGLPLSEGLRKFKVRPPTAYYSVDQATSIVKVDVIAYTP